MGNTDLKSKVFSGLVWQFGERFTAQAMSLFISIILARILDPNDYGVVAIVMIFITIANVFVTSGFGNALIQKKDADNLDFSSIFYFNLIFGFFLYILLFISAPYIAAYYNSPLLTNLLRVLGIRIVIASINSIQRAYISRNLLFKKFFWSTLIGTIISGFVGVYMAKNNYGDWALVGQYLTNTAIDTIVLFITVDWRPQLCFSYLKTKRLVKYGWKLLASALLDTGFKQIRSLIIGKNYSPTDLAYYNQGEKFPSLIVTNINASIGSVIFPTMSRFQNDKVKLKELTRKAIQLSSYLLWPCMIGFASVAEPFVRLALTDKWLFCVPYIRIFCVSYGFWPIHTANLQAINAMGRSDIFLKLEIIKKIIGTLIILVSMNYGVMCIAIGMIITDIISTFINSFPNKNLLHYSFFEQMKDIIPSIFISSLMGIIIFPISKMGFSPLMTVGVQVLCAVIIYLILSIITKNNSFNYILSLLKTRKKNH